MDFHDLQALVLVNRHGSLHATAKASGVPRSTLRRRLDRLEAFVGAPVLASDGRGLRLTPVGTLTLEHAGDLLARREVLIQAVRGALEAPEGTVRVLTCSGFPPALTAAFMVMSCREYPGVSLDVRRACLPFESLDASVDLLVTWADHEPPSRGVSRVFHRLSAGLMASSAYLDARGRPGSLEELDGHVLLHERGMPPSWPLLDGGTHPFRATHRVDDAYLLGCAAAAGLGIAFVPSAGAGLHPTFESLEPVLPDLVGGQRGVQFHAPMATRHRGPVSVIVEQLDQMADLVEAGR